MEIVRDNRVPDVSPRGFESILLLDAPYQGYSEISRRFPEVSGTFLVVISELFLLVFYSP